MKSETEWAAQAARNLTAVRDNRPLVHNLTNYVVMNFTANILLAAGASPVMAHAENEVEEMVALAKALVLNIGTLDNAWIAAMIKAGKRARQLGVPVILDPVGAGATTLRTDTAHRILAETRVSIVRGNASEIMALGGGGGTTKGVDSADSVAAATEQAMALSRKLGVPVAITGPMDFITDGQRQVRVMNGHPLMCAVTGTGCAATALIGAFAGVDPDPVSAAATALAVWSLTGERAAEGAPGPGTFMIRLIDTLHTLTADTVIRGVRIQED